MFVPTYTQCPEKWARKHFATKTANLHTKLYRKGKERESIYIAPFCTRVHTKRSGMDHTVLPANNTMPAFPSWRSPDGTTTTTEAADIQLQLTILIYRPRKDERLSWLGWLTYSGWFTHINGHPSATGREQESESTPAKDRCSIAGPRSQPITF